METKSVQVDIDLRPQERVLHGYAATYGGPPDAHGDIFAKGAFEGAIKKIKDGGIPLLDTHVSDSEHVLGTVVDAYSDETGLFIEARLADTPKVEEIRQKLMQGHIKKMSVGFYIKDMRYDRYDGQEVRVITDVDMVEVSVVPIPANDRAEILSVKSDGEARGACDCNPCTCEKQVEEVVEQEQPTESALPTDEEVTILEKRADLLGMSIKQTRRKYNGK